MVFNVGFRVTLRGRVGRDVGFNSGFFMTVSLRQLRISRETLSGCVAASHAN
jgi:hypothetical protein